MLTGGNGMVGLGPLGSAALSLCITVQPHRTRFASIFSRGGSEATIPDYF
jgi:hypothetical protein